MSEHSATHGGDTGKQRQLMVRVMRKRVAGFDDVSSEALVERIAKLERALSDPAQQALHTSAQADLRACCRALEPDFAQTKVHHATSCWYVDRYEEGRFSGGARRRFVLVPVSSVPEDVSGCQFCESGRPAAVKLKVAGSSPDSGSALAPAPPVRGSVQLGCDVHVADDATGRSHQWRLVSPREADPANGRISAESPIGKALVGRLPGELIEIAVPKGIRRVKIIEVVPAAPTT